MLSDDAMPERPLGQRRRTRMAPSPSSRQLRFPRLNRQRPDPPLHHSRLQRRGPASVSPRPLTDLPDLHSRPSSPTPVLLRGNSIALEHAALRQRPLQSQGDRPSTASILDPSACLDRPTPRSRLSTPRSTAFSFPPLDGDCNRQPVALRPFN
ncbi:hypothetical protein OF83DRAFT_1158527 [Amylostereum chailletii]|nr:hypothetical protein OF83DRAFT_1158527 [Amylostereum chailletii]